jgi:hypothetical protein
VSSMARSLATSLPGRLAPALVLAAACVAPDPPHGEEAGEASPPPVAELVIDGGAELALAPGEGIGVGVEYAGEGRWSVTTSCDTSLTGLACSYDLIVSTDELSPITDYAGAELDAGDRLIAPDTFVLAAAFETSDDLDEFGFTTSPGATVRVSALLYDPDGGWNWHEDPRVISWVGNGAVHRGAPTNPVDLTPDRP